MQLTFGNMTIELNIFYSCKKHGTKEEDELMKDYLIELHMEKLVKECWRSFFKTWWSNFQWMDWSLEDQRRNSIFEVNEMAFRHEESENQEAWYAQ